MARVVVVLLLALLVLLKRSQYGAEAKYANGKRRVGHRLEISSLQQHQVSSVTQCLRLCDGVADCMALNYGTVSEAINCQLLGQRACDGLPLLADAAVDYYDVYDGPQNRNTTETQTTFWDDPGCVQDGYCAAECAAEAIGDFCTVDAHCTEKLMPPGGYQCYSGACELSADFWELRPGLVLPRWQLWRADWSGWTWKKLKPGTCTLDIRVKLGAGAMITIATSSLDDLSGRVFYYRLHESSTTVYYRDDAGTIQYLAEAASTPGLVGSDTFSPLRISWCGGAMTIGPADNPTLISGQATVTQSMEYLMVTSSGAPSWMYVDSGVADQWLFDDSGVAEDAVMNVAPRTYVHRSIAATNDVTVKYDCMAPQNCLVILQTSSDTPSFLKICVGCTSNTESILQYGGNVTGIYNTVITGPVLSETEFNTFTVRYNNGHVTIHRNENPVPIYEVDAPHLLTDINIIGIGGSSNGPKYVRAARYDPGWRTDTWLTEGRGFSSDDILV